MLGRHFESVILYCVGQFKIEKIVFCAGEKIVFYHTGKKSLEIVLQEIPCPYGLGASFFNSATSMREVLPRLN